MGYTAGLTRESGAAPLERVQISLAASRINGENFPQYEGEFFYVESVDSPCRISFNGRDDSQSLGLSSGFQINMPFSGFKLFHDDYSVGRNSTIKTAFLTVYTSRSPRAFNQFVNPAVQNILPFEANFGGTGIYSATYPLFPRLRFLTSEIVAVFGYNAALPLPSCQMVGQFWDVNNQFIDSGIIVKNGINFSRQSVSVNRFFKLDPIFFNGAQCMFSQSLRNIPVPTNAEYFRLTFTFYDNPPTFLQTDNHTITVT